MRASLHSFITHEPNRRDRINHIWRPLRGKCGILADYVNSTDGTRMIADADMILTGLNITSATAAVAVESGGNFYAVVASTVNEAILGPATLANGSPLTEFTWGTDQETEVEWLIQHDAVDTDRWTKAGLALTDAIDDTVGAQAADNDQAYFSIDENVGVIDGGVSVNTADLLTTGLHTLQVSDYVHLAIKFDPSGVAHFFVNGMEKSVGQPNFGGAVGAGNVVDLIPFYGQKEDTSGAADPKINLIGFAISRALGA